MQRVYISEMVHRSAVLASSLLLSVAFLSVATMGAARADDGAADPGAILLDITGEISTADFTGGVADPVPIFTDSSGPVIFVMSAPDPGESAIARAHRTRIRANPELNRR